MDRKLIKTACFCAALFTILLYFASHADVLAQSFDLFGNNRRNRFRSEPSNFVWLRALIIMGAGAGGFVIG